MGKWSQYRKRGAGNQGTTGIGAPPAPLLQQILGLIAVTAQGGDDTAGQISVRTSATIGGPFEEIDNRPWAPVQSIGTSGDFIGYYVLVVEIGNDTAYVGESPPSNILDFT